VWIATLPVLFAFGSAPCLPQELGHLTPAPAPHAMPARALLALLPPPPPPPAPLAGRSFGNGTTPLDETMSYTVDYSLLGRLGDLQLWFVHPGHGVRAVAVGKGTLIGAGTLEKRVDSQIDPHAAGTTRWVSTRVQSGKTITDTIVQSVPGSVEVLRRRADRPDQTHNLRRGRPLLDPLGFLFALRARPPAAAETFEVLDGRALWIITLRPARSATLDGQGALAVAGHAEAILWDGSPDRERTDRDFTVWLSSDQLHTPLKLVVPLALGEVRVSLARIDRTTPKARAELGPPATIRNAAEALLRTRSTGGN
jgi:hypothetical protein